jgi:branched-subunit amino acid transport protein AzlD
MTATWIVIAVLCVGTVAMKAVGPLVSGQRRPRGRINNVIDLLPTSVLSALVVYETATAITDDGHPAGPLIGLTAAGLALALRAPMLVVLVAAATATALARILV